MIETTAYKTKLEEQLKNIVEDLSVIGVRNLETDDWIAIPDKEMGSEADPNSEADIAEESEERQATLSVLEIEYRDIKRALKKIEEGTYGICEISGEPIEEARLQAKPDARTSIAHMDEEDKLPL